MIYLSNDPYPQEISIPRSFGVIVPQRKVYLTEDDIAANLETDSDRKVLAASQGVALKRMVDEKADADDVYTKSQVDDALEEKQDTLTPGENIRIENNVISAVVPEVDAYTKQETDELLSQKADKSDTYTKEQVDTALAGKANASDIPTKTSDLDNDSGFVTGQEVSQTYETKQDATAKQTALQTEIDGKADKEGEFPDMLVGTAESLLGTGSQVSDFVFSPMPGADGIAKLNAARGKSLVWNQLANNAHFPDATRAGVVFGHDNGVITANGTASAADVIGGWLSLPQGSIPVGHIVLVRGRLLSGTITNGTLGADYAQSTTTAGADILNTPVIRNNASAVAKSNVWFASGTTFNNAKIALDYIDLTLMFGAGNEPSSVDEFEAKFPLPYYDYEPGRIVSNKTESVKVTGFNQWDEEWELGTYGYDGVIRAIASSTQIRNKNLIPVFPNTTYCIYCESNADGFFICVYDEVTSGKIGNGTVHARTSGKIKTFTTGANAKYVSFSMAASYGTTYKNDICINLSDPARNGQYVPYKTNTIQLNLPTLTGKLNGEGESVVVFPDGLKSAGSVYDEIVGNKAIKRVGVVDLGSLSWNVGNAAGGFYASTGNIGRKSSSNNLLVRKYATISPTNTFTDKSICQRPGSGNENWINAFDSAYANNTGSQFKSAMSGVLLYYELATPVEYILDEPLPGTFRGYKGGTIKQLPENTSVPVTAPMVMEATYPADMAAGTADSITAMLNAMKAAGIFSSYTMTYNPATGNYQFTFTR